MAQPFGRIGRPRHDDVLTPAEWEVLAGVREGRTNREIAAERGCDPETVRFHLKNLRRKLGVHTRDGLRAFPGRPAAARERASRRTRTRRIREQIPLIDVADMAHSLNFYVDVLGFEIVSSWPEEPGTLPGWVALASGGARVMLRRGHPKRRVDHARRAGTVTLSLYVDRVDAFRRALMRAGVKPGPIDTLFYGAREFYVQDPDGNELAIVEFAASQPSYLTQTRRTEDAG